MRLHPSFADGTGKNSAASIASRLQTGGGTGLRLDLPARNNVARMERSEIRERSQRSTVDPGLRCAPSGLRRKKGSGTPKGVDFQPPRQDLPRGRGAAALHRERPPLGVPPRFSPGGLSSPKAQRQAMLPGTRPERSILYGRPNRGAETSRRDTGVTRAEPVPVQRSTSRAGHSAGRMMPKPPGSKGDEPKPAGTALAPPAGVAGWRPLRERDSQSCISNRDNCQYVSIIETISRRLHCEPTDPREVARSDDRLREAIQLCAADWIASSLRSSQ
jgi:hypothetical protein